MMSTPWRTHIFTEPALVAWAATRSPRPWATLDESGEFVVVDQGRVGVGTHMSPIAIAGDVHLQDVDAFGERNLRAARRNASAPSQMYANRALSGIGKWAWSRSPRFPVGVISWLAANIRGPAI